MLRSFDFSRGIDLSAILGKLALGGWIRLSALFFASPPSRLYPCVLAQLAHHRRTHLLVCRDPTVHPRWMRKSAVSLPVGPFAAPTSLTCQLASLSSALYLRHAARRRRELPDQVELAEQLVVRRHLRSPWNTLGSVTACWLSSAVE